MVARFWSFLTTLTLFLGLSTSTSHTQSHSTKFDFDSTCSSISSHLSIPNATNIASTLIQANTNLTFPNNDPSCNRPFQIVLTDTCRITMSIATSVKSGIEFEAWFPRNWTGRFLSTGNGGLSGCIQYEDLAYTAALGFAAVGANNGHNGMSGAPFLNNPDVLEDFVYRSIHTSVLIGKNLTSTFYGIPHSKSYYLGCSTGGRQALKTVQDFPSDFDGIVAGAPAADFNHLIDWSGHFLEITGTNDSSTFLSTEKWVTLVHPDVLRQCDEIDGVRDGIIEDPSLCDYDPSGLVCKDEEGEEENQSSNASCITQVQADMIKEVYKPFFINGELAYPRLQPGSEDLPVFFTGQQFIFTADWFRYVVYSDPTYDVNTLSEKDWALAEDLDPFNISTWKADLSAFRDRQGKLLTYHGQTDGLISPLNSERYYDRVTKTMGLTSSEQDEFYRFFRISGMGHCSGGVGAWEIGQTLAGSRNLANLDPESNVLTAMVRWIEQGVAPESVLGRKFVNDDTNEGVAFSRKHCKYPLRNTYDGVGDSTKPESWKCL
ncbi:tannase and feruloyl esterase [Dendrothele bispora CBS 962.96]|uniref:Carboxylic ester hydrolase n=1 Tax=Dendrothele bispora (strain CBS 962.96) TaxID=1314807 RepID=A0A4S8L767_DENBC|nr:tannase and feruloyl esterase [Dendrothele bispora CBS 962.96]